MTDPVEPPASPDDDHIPPLHPGAVLREHFMVPLDLTARALAEDLDLPDEEIEAILNQQLSITDEVAARLAGYFKTTPEMWTDLQASYEQDLAEENKAANARTAMPGETK